MSTTQAFDYSIDELQFIFWQYDIPNDKNISQLINQKQAAIKLLQEDFWEGWEDTAFNIDKLDDFGVALWAYILDVPLLQVGPAANSEIGFGFGPSGGLPEEDNGNFENSNFNIPASGSSILTLAQKRIALKFKYRKLTTRGTVPDINQILLDLLVDDTGVSLGPSYVVDNLDMTINYVFEFEIPNWVLFIAVDLDLFPTPQAVGDNFVQNPPSLEGSTFLFFDGDGL